MIAWQPRLAFSATAIAVLVTSLLGAGPVELSQAHAQSAQTAPARSTGVPVAVIDIRPGAATSEALGAERQVLLSRIEGSPDMSAAATTDRELSQALAGQLLPVLDSEREAAGKLVDEAAAAFGQLDCVAAERAAQRAILTLAGVRASQKANATDLQRAHVYQLLCAHNRNDSDRAMRARALLERLGVTRKPTGISDLVWNLYPPLDATSNTPIHEVEVRTDPTGASVWVDYASVGKAPDKVLLPVGEHIVAAALGGRHRAIQVTVDRDAQVVEVGLPVARSESRHLPLSQLVADWQRGQSEPTGEQIGALLGQVGVRFALVLVPPPDQGKATSGPTKNSTGRGVGTGDNYLIAVWSLSPNETTARPLVVEKPARLASIGQAVRIRAYGWRPTGPERDVELLRETPNGPTGRRDTSKRPRWWVYASIAGAVALGATLFLANDLADNRQRIEVTW